MRPGHGGSHGLQHPGPQTRAGVMITSPRGRPAADEFLALCHAAKASATGTAARRAAGRSALCWRHFRTSQKRNTTAPNRRQGWAGGAGSERGRERGHGNDHRCGPEQGHQRPSGGPAAGAVALVRDQEAGTGAAAVARVLADTPELGREQVTGLQPGSRVPTGAPTAVARVPGSILRSWDGSNRVPTGFQPGSNRVPTGFQPGSNRVPTGFQPGSNRVPTGFQPGSNRVPTGFQPGSNRVPTGFQPGSGMVRRSTVAPSPT